MSFFVFLYGLCFKVYFVWYEYCNSCFLIISICMKYLFLSPRFQSVCLLPYGGSLQIAYCRLLFFFNPVCHSVFLSGAFSLLTVKVIIDIYAMAPHSSTLAWKIPWTEEPGWLQSMGSHRVGHDWSNLAAACSYCYFKLCFPVDSMFLFRSFFFLWFDDFLLFYAYVLFFLVFVTLLYVLICPALWTPWTV